MALNPGVSTTKELHTSYNSVCLVVCLPLPKAIDISLVLSSRLLSSVFNRVDLPLPDCPAKMTVFPLIISLI